MTTAPIADVRGLTIGPETGPATVVGVDLAVRRGEVLGIVGRSGSGKTTLSLALLGHVRPGLRVREGTVRVAGIDPLTRDGARRVRGRVVTFLGQDPASALNPARRVGAQLAEAVTLRAPGKTTRSFVADEVARLLTGVGLPADRAFLRRHPHQISGGQAQRVALAVALAGSPDLVVLDEPTSGLDTVHAARTRALVADTLRGSDRAALLVSHDPHLVAGLADRVLEMEAGRVVAEGAAHEVLADRLKLVPVTPRETAPRRGAGLELRDVSAYHHKRKALNDVSATVAPGSCTAIVGPSGSGKTTLARCVAGLHAHTAGTISWAGAGLPAGYQRRTPAARKEVQLVQQDPVGALNPRESVRQALRRPLVGVRGLPAPAADAEIVRLLARVRLAPDMAARLPSGLSGGERQRVALARALAADPRVLVCDEVTSALDPETADTILDLLDDLRRELGLTVVMVTHDLAVVARRAEHVVVLDAGDVVESGPVHDVLTAPSHKVTRELIESAPSLAAPGVDTAPAYRLG
ncbi:MAG TPA: ATP-binding cassette domain-containing protein [Yinghuangia sp.]|nr:ATP-binding cassette domain-containing protein [Yinghuangia sp.]